MMDAARRQRARSKGVNVEFSLALNNRTGKYVAGLGLLEALEPDLNSIYFWRHRAQRVPSGLAARILGRLMTHEVRFRCKSKAFDNLIPKLRPVDPIIFTDPLQILLYQLRCSDLVIIHDLGPITHPAFYAPGVQSLYEKVFAKICAARPHLVFVSKASQREFDRVYGPIGRTQHVIYNPVRTTLASGNDAPPHGVSPPFLLTVGAVGDRKNQVATIKAFKSSGLADRGYQYVICGGPEPGFERVRDIAALTSGVLLLGHAPEAQLRWLYRHAEGFILASHLEGFGMPAAEALAAGLLPLVSRDSALSEVAGSPAIHVSADHVSSITAGILQLTCLSTHDRRRRIDQAARALDRFSPAHIASDWRDHLRSIGLLGLEA